MRKTRKVSMAETEGGPCGVEVEARPVDRDDDASLRRTVGRLRSFVRSFLG